MKIFMMLLYSILNIFTAHASEKQELESVPMNEDEKTLDDGEPSQKAEEESSKQPCADNPWDPRR